jgi:hypothetical protein
MKLLQRRQKAQLGEYSGLYRTLQNRALYGPFMYTATPQTTPLSFNHHPLLPMLPTSPGQSFSYFL